MHQVQVEIVGAEIFEGGGDGGVDVVRMVRVVPEFGGYEDFGAGDAGLLDGSANGGLGAVAGRG